MIMAKFAAMEEFLHKAGGSTAREDGGAETPSADVAGAATAVLDATRESSHEHAVPGGERPESARSESRQLTELELEEIYRRTALQPVRMLQANWLAATGDADVDERHMRQVLAMQFVTDDDAAYFLDLDGDVDDWWDREYGRGRKRKRSAKASGALLAKREPKEPQPRRKRKRLNEDDPAGARKRASAIVRCEMQDGYGRKFVFKKRDKTVDPRVPQYTRMPPDLTGWAHIIAPFVAQPPRELPGARYAETDILRSDLTQFGTAFQAILMDPPLRRDSDPAEPGTVSVSQLAELRLTSELFPFGLLFIWVEKRLMPSVFALAEGWGLKYVENIVWVRLGPDNGFACEPGPHFNNAKHTLMVFKRDGELDLRHQRNADVIFDFVAPAAGYAPGSARTSKPQHVFTTIETLLPRAVYDAADPVAQPGRLLELWAERGTLRPSWTKLVDTADIAAAARSWQKLGAAK